MGIFNFLRRKSKVGGIVKYLNLEHWWTNELSDEEKEIILSTYTPLGGGDSSIIEGEIYSTSQTPLHFLWGMVGWFNKPQLRHVAYKVISKAESLINKESEPLDIHFLYNAKIEVCYSDRDSSPNGLNLAIQACEQQILFSSAAAEAYVSKYKTALPAHKGYQQLAIILEKQGKYSDAISLCKQASAQGWAGDWEKRIERCTQKSQA